MDLTMHERNFLRQRFSRPEVHELLTGGLCLFQLKRGLAV
jgi:hypothetical protein